MRKFTYIFSKNEIHEIEGKFYFKKIGERLIFDWWDVACELKNQGLEDSQITIELNKRGFLSPQKRPISTDMIRSKRWREKRSKKMP
jgi:hypothetical protein